MNKKNERKVEFLDILMMTISIFAIGLSVWTIRMATDIDSKLENLDNKVKVHNYKIGRNFDINQWNNDQIHTILSNTEKKWVR